MAAGTAVSRFFSGLLGLEDRSNSMEQLLGSSRTSTAQCDAIAAVARGSRWLVVVGDCDPGLLAAGLTGPSAVLALVPNGAAVDLVHEHWTDHWPEHLQVMEKLVGSEVGEKAWFRYNDPRFDGVTRPEVLRRTYPNLRLKGMELREQITLAQALQGWPPAQCEPGALVLVGAGAEQVLSPANSNLRTVHTILWLDTPPDLSTELLAQLDEQLRQNWLLRSQKDESLDRDLIWRRNHQLQQTATLEAERDETITQNGQLKAQLETIYTERDQLASEKEGITRERDGLQQKLDIVNQELKGTLALIDQVSKERNQLQNERDQLTTKQTELEQQHKSLREERDQLASENSINIKERKELQQKLDIINKELDAILALIDQVNIEASGQKLPAAST